jgi:hypothetical protein
VLLRSSKAINYFLERELNNFDQNWGISPPAEFPFSNGLETKNPLLKRQIFPPLDPFPKLILPKAGFSPSIAQFPVP